MNSVVIPDALPELLKQYVKAAIRSQPEDIISWSAEYFKTTDEQCTSMSTCENSTTFKQDRTLFRILAFQLGTTVGTKERIEEVWSDLSLDFILLEQIYSIGKFHSEHVDMVEFLGVTFGHWTKSLKETVLLCCEAFCKCLATDGYFLHVDVACKLYGFLAKLDCSLPAVDNSSGVDPQNNNNNNNSENDSKNNAGTTQGAAAAAVKTCSKSLDVSYPTPLAPLAENKLKRNAGASLESIFVAAATANGPVDDDDIFRYRGGAGHYVQGIGSCVSDAQVRKVIDYFRKCAADNGGYVYDFDIENPRCPQLDAVVVDK